MKILFAAPDRDLLRAYKEILTEDFGETQTAFDGPQMLTLLAEGNYDLAVLDKGLPRIENKLLIDHLKSEGIPVLSLLDCREKKEAKDSFNALCYPFTPAELEKSIKLMTSNTYSTLASESKAVTENE